MNNKKVKALRKVAGGNIAEYDVTDLTKVSGRDPVTKEPVYSLTHLYTLTSWCSRRAYKVLKKQFKLQGEK
jgi:hypothetical protein